MKTKCMSCGGTTKKMLTGGAVKKYRNGGTTDSLKIIRREGKLAVKTEKQKQAAAKKQATLAKKIAKAKENARLNLEWQKMSKEQKDSLYMEELKDRRKRFKEGGAIKKMAVGGTTTKRIVKKSTGGMYGIPQENLGTSGQYGFGKKGGAVKKMKTGGTTKAAKFAALAPPYNKATFADKIAGAKKRNK